MFNVQVYTYGNTEPGGILSEVYAVDIGSLINYNRVGGQMIIIKQRVLYIFNFEPYLKYHAQSFESFRK